MKYILKYHFNISARIYVYDYRYPNISTNIRHFLVAYFVQVVNYIITIYVQTYFKQNYISKISSYTSIVHAYAYMIGTYIPV